MMTAMLFAFLLNPPAPRIMGVAPRGELQLVVVSDGQHPIPGVAVTLLHLDGTPAAKPLITDGLRPVTFSHLPAGQYLVRCELSGYVTTTIGPLPIELVKEAPRLPRELTVLLNPGPVWY